MRAEILDLQTGAGNKVLDRARGEHLTRTGKSGDSGADVGRDPAKRAVHQLALTGVNTRTNR
jgi:hypothetical protein